MRDIQATADGLRSAIERSGYYPGLVADAVSSALGSEDVVSFVVHHDALFDPAMEVRRHMSVLVLTPTRLIYSHTDENPADEWRAYLDIDDDLPVFCPEYAGREFGGEELMPKRRS